MLPIALALMAAMLFGVSSIIAKRGLSHVDPQAGATLAIGATALVFALTSPLWMRAGQWFTPGFWVFVANGLIHPMLSLYMALESLRRAGPTVSATFTATAPLFAALTAVLFLGESFTLPIAAGTLGTIAGIIAISWQPGGVPTLLRTALLFATGAAAVRGLNHSVGKFGLELLPNVFMAGFVSFSVSFIGSLIVYRMRTGGFPRGVPRGALLSFGTTGLLVAGAISCMYGALLLGQVVIVSPIVASYPLFTMLSAWVFRQEALRRRAVFGVLLVVGGVVLISFGQAA
ncbi:MAG: EamA family transporter [Gammaproteobacteria bacterium]